MKRYCAERVSNLYKTIGRNLKGCSKDEDVVAQHAEKVKEVDSVDDYDYTVEENRKISKSVV